jgi:flagellar assembly factor FliW
MKILSERFGTFEIDAEDIIHFPDGLIGFGPDQKFVLVRHRKTSPIGWLQSVTDPDLALPVVSVDALALQDPTILAAARLDGGKIKTDPAPEYAVMAVLCAPPGQRATVNLLAPLVVDVRSHQGAQVILDSTAYSTQEPFVLRQVPTKGGVMAPAQDLDESTPPESGMQPPTTSSP